MYFIRLYKTEYMEEGMLRVRVKGERAPAPGFESREPRGAHE